MNKIAQKIKTASHRRFFVLIHLKSLCGSQKGQKKIITGEKSTIEAHSPVCYTRIYRRSSSMRGYAYLKNLLFAAQNLFKVKAPTVCGSR